MNILGINAYHGDSSAALIIDGRLVAAIEEERFKRIKHWAGFPAESIRFCLEDNNLSLSDIDVIAINQDKNANFLNKLKFIASSRPDLKLILNRIKNKLKRQGIVQQIETLYPGQVFNGKLIPVEHHLAHLSSAFHVSPFDSAITVSVDGFGDFSSCKWGIGKGTGINVIGQVNFPHSLGIFYQALTQYLGFPNYGDEYKIMGLAPYGEDKYRDAMQNIVSLLDDGSFALHLDYFRHHRERIEYQWEDGYPRFSHLFSDRLEQLLGIPPRGDATLEQHHKDIAHSVQAMYETAFFHLLNTIYKQHPVDQLVIAGGCGMNSVANGKIYRNTPFKKVFIQAAAGDAGGAIGAAYTAWFQLSPGVDRDFVMSHAYWGPEYDDETIMQVINASQEKLTALGCEVIYSHNDNLLYENTARNIAEGKVVGWFQGRMEWGPRALGNRSILCDPRNPGMKEILNQKIKRRESFRPFAPSILREEVADWFEEDDDVPFMMKVFQIREEKRKQIPAVTHVDGSGRLQTVSRNNNPRYYDLIKSFHNLTGVPLVLNTSFNENEPIVCKPEEALDCFLRTNMDLLVMGNTMITRS